LSIYSESLRAGIFGGLSPQSAALLPLYIVRLSAHSSAFIVPQVAFFDFDLAAYTCPLVLFLGVDIYTEVDVALLALVVSLQERACYRSLQRTAQQIRPTLTFYGTFSLPFQNSFIGLEY
jgi:hypothetical protein